MADLYESKCPKSDIFGYGLVTLIFYIMGLDKMKNVALFSAISSYLIFLPLADVIKKERKCNG